MSKVEELEKEISALPRGYITHRTVNKKVYYYNQGMINGEQFCISVHEKDVESYSKDIEKRKELEKRLKMLKAGSVIENPRKNKINTTTNILTGKNLEEFAYIASKFEKRDCFETIKNYIKSETNDKICIIYGLRRTGKTTLIKQIIADSDPAILQKTVYIKCCSNDTTANLNRDLNQLRDAGFKYIFIDEVTLISDFIDSSSLLSDVFAAQGMKIILSGTDSLGFHFATTDELYDRAVTVHTTYISFKEHSRLLGINNIDEYIRYGGTLKAGELDFENKEINAEEASFRDDETTRHYIDTAICSNIQHSIECFKDGRYFRNLRELYMADELTNAINRIIENINHSFTEKVITGLFCSHDLSSAVQLLRSEKDKSKRTDILDRINKTPILEKLKSILSTKEKEEQKTGITNFHFEEIKEYLKTLDLIENITIETRYPDNPKLNSAENYIIFTQPGMRFCQAQALVYSIFSDPCVNIFSPEEKVLIQDKIIEDVKGRMLEDIVILKTKKAIREKDKNRKNSKKVFKLRFKDGEFDMVIADSSTGTCSIYEIKHSSQRDKKQYRHLINSEMLNTAEAVYGTITGKTVLYKGENFTESNGIRYKNVEEYLKEL